MESESDIWLFDWLLAGYELILKRRLTQKSAYVTPTVESKVKVITVLRAPTKSTHAQHGITRQTILYTVTLQYLCLQNAGVFEWVPQCTGQEFSSIGVLSSIHVEPTGRFLHTRR